jgi:hypothetical protein
VSAAAFHRDGAGSHTGRRITLALAPGADKVPSRGHGRSTFALLHLRAAARLRPRLLAAGLVDDGLGHLPQLAVAALRQVDEKVEGLLRRAPPLAHARSLSGLRRSRQGPSLSHPGLFTTVCVPEAATVDEAP